MPLCGGAVLACGAFFGFSGLATWNLKCLISDFWNECVGDGAVEGLKNGRHFLWRFWAGLVVGLHDFDLFCPRGEKSFVDCISGSLSANAVRF
jgi:hypothetical protein